MYVVYFMFFDFIRSSHAHVQTQDGDGSRSSVSSKKRKFTPQRHSKQSGGLHNGNSRNNNHAVSPVSLSNSSRSSRGKMMKQSHEEVMSPNRGKGTMHAFFAPKDSTSQPSDTISPKVTPSSTTISRSVSTSGSKKDRIRKKRKAEAAAQENRDGGRVENNKKLKSRKKIQVQDKKQQEDVSTKTTSVVTASSDDVERLKKELEIVKKSENLLRDEVKRLLLRNEESLKQYESKLKQKESAAAKIFEKVMRAKASRDALDARKKLASESVRLGEIVTVHSRSIRNSVTEIWKDGHAFKSLHEEMGQLIERKESLEKQKKVLERERRGMLKEFKKLSDSEQEMWVEPLEFVERQESVKEALGQLKDKELRISEDRKKLESEKKLHVREIKRIQSEDQSRFNKHPVLHNRYLLMKLLGMWCSSAKRENFFSLYHSLTLVGMYARIHAQIETQL